MRDDLYARRVVVHTESDVCRKGPPYWCPSGAMPHKKRPAFKWQRMPGRSTSLPVLGVKDFAPEITKEAQDTRMRIVDILSKSPVRAAVVPIPSTDFKPGEDCWHLASSAVRQRLRQRHEEDMKIVEELHQRLEIACNRLTRESPKSSPTGTDAIVRTQVFDIPVHWSRRPTGIAHGTHSSKTQARGVAAMGGHGGSLVSTSTSTSTGK